MQAKNPVKVQRGAINKQKAAYTNALRKSYLDMANKNNRWPASFLWHLIISIVLLGLALLLFLWLPNLPPASEKDFDPQELTDALINRKADIYKLIPTPRGVKRFSNKARMQYHILKGKGIFGNYVTVDDLVEILMQETMDKDADETKKTGSTESEAQKNIREEVKKLNRPIIAIHQQIKVSKEKKREEAQTKK